MSYPRSHSQSLVKGICFMDLAQVVSWCSELSRSYIRVHKHKSYGVMTVKHIVTLKDSDNALQQPILARRITSSEIPEQMFHERTRFQTQQFRPKCLSFKFTLTFRVLIFLKHCAAHMIHLKTSFDTKSDSFNFYNRYEKIKNSFLIYR